MTEILDKHVLEVPRLVRLSLDIDERTHKELKHICINRNCTLKKLVIRAVAKLIREENEVNEAKDGKD